MAERHFDHRPDVGAREGEKERRRKRKKGRKKGGETAEAHPSEERRHEADGKKIRDEAMAAENRDYLSGLLSSINLEIDLSERPTPETVLPVIYSLQERIRSMGGVDDGAIAKLLVGFGRSFKDEAVKEAVQEAWRDYERIAPRPENFMEELEELLTLYGRELTEQKDEIQKWFENGGKGSPGAFEGWRHRDFDRLLRFEGRLSTLQQMARFHHEAYFDELEFLDRHFNETMTAADKEKARTEYYGWNREELNYLRTILSLEYPLGLTPEQITAIETEKQAYLKDIFESEDKDEDELHKIEAAIQSMSLLQSAIRNHTSIKGFFELWQKKDVDEVMKALLERKGILRLDDELQNLLSNESREEEWAGISLGKIVSALLVFDEKKADKMGVRAELNYLSHLLFIALPEVLIGREAPAQKKNRREILSGDLLGAIRDIPFSKRSEARQRLISFLKEQGVLLSQVFDALNETGIFEVDFALMSQPKEDIEELDMDDLEEVEGEEGEDIDEDTVVTRPAPAEEPEDETLDPDDDLDRLEDILEDFEGLEGDFEDPWDDLEEGGEYGPLLDLFDVNDESDKAHRDKLLKLLKKLKEKDESLAFQSVKNKIEQELDTINSLPDKEGKKRSVIHFLNNNRFIQALLPNI